jgi:hypothetical protein
MLAHLGGDEEIGTKRTALPGDRFLFWVFYEPEIPDYPVTIELEEIVRLDVTMRYVLGSQPNGLALRS